MADVAHRGAHRRRAHTRQGRLKVAAENAALVAADVFAMKPPADPTRARKHAPREGVFAEIINDGLHNAELRMESNNAYRRWVDSVAEVFTVTDAGMPGRCTVIHPRGADVAPGSKLRTTFERVWVQRFGADTRFAFDWPPGTNEVRITPVGPVVTLPTLVTWEDYLAAVRHSWNYTQLPFGMTTHGPLLWDVIDYPGALIGGASRQGKTALLRMMTLSAIRAGWWLWICDPKQVDFVWADRYPAVRRRAVAVPDIVACLGEAGAEMNDRYAAMAREGVVNWPKWRVQRQAQGRPVPPLCMVLIDEANLFDTEGLSDDDAARRRAAFRAAADLSSRGAGCGMVLIVATQFPYAHIVKGWMRGNLTVKAAVGWLAPEQSRTVLNNDGAARLPTAFVSGEGDDAVEAPARGRAYVRVGREHEVQLPWLDEDDVHLWLPPDLVATPDWRDRAAPKPKQPAKAKLHVVQAAAPEAPDPGDVSRETSPPGDRPPGADW